MSLDPDVLVKVIFDTLIAQLDWKKLWHVMEYISDQIYSRISASYDEHARQTELLIFQVLKLLAYPLS
jgi:hypothetical protein